VPGPGFLNTTAALSTAYATNAPLLCLTGQIHTDHIGRGYGLLHEIPDQLGVLRSLTKWARRVENAAEVPRLQKEFHAGRFIATDLVNPDFVAFAKSFGALGVRVHSANGLRDALTDAFAADLPVVIEVPVGEMPGPWRRMYPAEVLFRR
jgi:thiamine pyrophosphate-dependent acetolactate synthase large subunit-like protein